MPTRGILSLAALVGSAALSSCGEDIAGRGLDDFGDLPVCELDRALLFASTSKDAIPSLIEPPMVPIADPSAEYLLDSDRVIAVVIDGQPRAYPHNVLWHHEIVSDRVGDSYVTATFCPLTGSGLVVDPDLGAERIDVGVSGLLFANNLVFYDRTSGDVYGPQLSVEGKCSRFRNQSFELLPHQEMSWGRWRVLHPNTLVVGGETGFDRNYRISPYAEYSRIDNDDLLFDMPVDRSRPLKERVLAIRIGDGGVGYPFGELADIGEAGALNEIVAGEPTVIFHEARDGAVATAFHARAGGQVLTFDWNVASDRWIDRETQSRWTVDGKATGGPLAGEQLAIRTDAFVVYWFAWRHFQPNATVWTR